MAETMTAPVEINVRDAGSRLNLRTAVPEIVGAAIAVTLPTKVGEAAESRGWTSVCLGPDEWMLTSLESEPDFGEIPAGFSLVDVSHREVAITVAGPGALDALAAGCPRDLSKFSVGAGVRTVFDGVSVVVLQRAEDAFELHVWRSYAPHVVHLLETVRAELAIGL
ncbi:MAG: sarcosine oxidase subunit gamma [Pseudomonadota bacterium]